MFDIHICDFYHDLSQIFKQLHARFPREDTLWLDGICGEDEVDEYGMHSKRYMSCFGTVLFLEREGFIRFSSREGFNGFNHCVLTLKGFQNLNKFKNDSQSPAIDEIRNAIKAKSSDQIEQAVKIVIEV
ncbi:MAG: hypothetical protein HRU38_06065 [Saccharospirillaceae bacterium]|nr:hypothetical protein [Pseudomonadales bacterium]NRB78223.1 hypothetical protein [Saccharospirillaceae bacterium]